MCCVPLAGNVGPKKLPKSRHLGTIPPSGHIFATKTRIDNWKKNFLSSNISPTCPHNMVNFGPPTAEIHWRVWGAVANFNGFRILAALLHGILVVGVSQTLWRLTQDATYIRQGGHQVGHWPTFLVPYCTRLVSYARMCMLFTRNSLSLQSERTLGPI